MNFEISAQFILVTQEGYLRYMATNRSANLRGYELKAIIVDGGAQDWVKSQEDIMSVLNDYEKKGTTLVWAREWLNDKTASEREINATPAESGRVY